MYAMTCTWSFGQDARGGQDSPLRVKHIPTGASPIYNHNRPTCAAHWGRRGNELVYFVADIVNSRLSLLQISGTDLSWHSVICFIAKKPNSR